MVLVDFGPFLGASVKYSLNCQETARCMSYALQWRNGVTKYDLECILL